MTEGVVGYSVGAADLFVGGDGAGVVAGLAHAGGRRNAVKIKGLHTLLVLGAKLLKAGVYFIKRLYYV